MRWRGRWTPKVEKLQRDGKVHRLIAAAGYRDRMLDRGGHVLDGGAPVRAAAIDALAGYQPAEGEDPPELFALFDERLGDESPEVVQAAARALAADASTEAASALVDLLVEAGPSLTPDTRSVVLDSLRACTCAGVSERWCSKVVEAREAPLQEPDRVTLLALIEADGVANPRQRVFWALGPRLVGHPGEDGVAARAETILSWCMPAGLDGLDRLITRYDVSAAGIRLAGQSGDQRLLTPLTHLLEHPTAAVRAQAAEALGTLCDTAAVLPLMGATSDPDVQVRRAAVRALDALGSAGVTAAMAVLAHSATVGAEREEPMLGGRPWSRTLARLTERAGSSTLARRLLKSEAEPVVGLVEARGRYEALVAETDSQQA